MKQTALTLAAAIIVGLVLLGYFIFSDQGTHNVQVTQVQLADLHTSIHTNGKAEAERIFEIRAPFSSLCTRIHVKEGDVLKEGQPILELDNSALLSDLAAARAELEAAEVDLRNIRRSASAEERNQAEADIARHRLDAESARKIVETNEWLYQRNAISKFELEESRRALARAEQGVRAAETRLRDLQKRFDESDERRVRTRLAAAKSRIEYLEKSVARAVVRAPANGTLYHFETRNGAFLNTGDIIGTLADLRKTRVRVFVDEPELGRVTMGAEVRVRWDARPNESWKGKVVRIPSQVVARGTRSVAEVLCEVASLQPSLIPNINLDVEIVTGEGPKVAALPRNCVFPEGKGHFVWIIRDGAAAKRMIQTGRSSPSVIEVTGGLSVGDSVIVPGPAPLSEGMKVRVER